MAKRERYNIRLKCSQCGQIGRADMSDAKAYKIEPGGYDSRPEGVTEGQFAIKGNDVVCSLCGVSAL